jgi:predicted phage-related endonuclease
VRIVEVVQGTPEWRQARLGRLTGSRVCDAFASIKKGEAAGRRNLRVQLVLERLTGVSQENDFHSPDMDRGSELEEMARSAYEAATGRFVEPVGFVEHDDLMTGCSPDGLTSDGLIEIKCPKAATHLDYIREGLPRPYFLQILHGLWLTGRAWGDFVSFHPKFPPPLRTKITRLYAKDFDVAAHELNVRLFLSEVDLETAAVEALAGAAA